MAPSANRELINKLRKTFCDAGQGHVFDWWDELSTDQRDRLIAQLSEIDLDLITRLAAQHLGSEPAAGAAHLEPAPVIPLARSADEKRRETRARRKGHEILKAGKAAAYMVAGGQSSRLGLKMAKGKFPIMPVSGKSLFQHHAEKVLALSRKFEVSIPLLILTSQTNNEETRSFFAEHGFFGLPREDVLFLTQGMLPALDFSGRLALQDKGALFMSPDGHGGAIRSLVRQGAAAELERRGIEVLFYFQVDNPLVKILDPVFLGYHTFERSEMSSKVVEKVDPVEKVGIVALIDGKPGVVEYSDLDDKSKVERNQDGRLRYSAGSIAIHLFDLAFLQRCEREGITLPYHKAEKKIAYLDESGAVVSPDAPNGVKFETFVFDALQYTRRSMAMEVAREEEFAPVKNASGSDSPETASRAITALFRSWLRRSGVQVNEDPGQRIEISPLFALDGEDFTERVKKKNMLLTSRLFIE